MMNSLLDPEILFPLIVAFAAGLALGAFYFTALVADSAAVAVSEKSCASDARKFYSTDGGSDGGILFDYGRRALGDDWLRP